MQLHSTNRHVCFTLAWKLFPFFCCWKSHLHDLSHTSSPYFGDYGDDDGNDDDDDDNDDDDDDNDDDDNDDDDDDNDVFDDDNDDDRLGWLAGPLGLGLILSTLPLLRIIR